jgi:hypothetical protein
LCFVLVLHSHSMKFTRLECTENPGYRGHNRAGSASGGTCDVQEEA